MRVILTNHSLNSLGGTETWTLTIGKELERLGHIVHVLPFDGKDNITNFSRYDGGHYDLGLINHNVCLEQLKNTDIDKKIFTSHGVIPKLESPIEGADFYVSISEEVKDNLEKKGYKSIIIRNPIDTNKFKPTNNINSKLENIVFISNYQGEAKQIVQRACEGLNLRIWGKENQTDKVVEEMNWADLVIGLSRTAYEAMSCDRNVIIYDYNGADGFIDNTTVFDYRHKNCSGRRNKKKLHTEQLKSLFDKYDPKLSMRSYVMKEHEVGLITEKYLNIENYV